ncbi:MAG: asparagine synthase, partial [Sphingobacteriales bacterium]
VQNPADKSQTFYKNISSLLPSHYLLLNTREGKFTLTRYWHLDKQNQAFSATKNYTGIFTQLLTDSINKRLRSDVQVGSSLSGGLDSSSIVAIVSNLLGQEKTTANFKTYSAIFPGFDKNEEGYIEKVTGKFSLQNHSVVATANGLVDDFEKLCYHQEEPFPSSSMYAQFKVMELAAQNGTKVLLDGQGADETLAGYNKYLHWYLQELISNRKFSEFKKAKQLFARHNMQILWGYKNYVAAFLPAHTAITLEKREHSYMTANPDISKKLLNHLKGREWDGIHKPIVSKLNDMLYFNTMESGLEEMLRFADRSSMAHGVEVRLPFLNAALVQFIFSCPTIFKIQDGFTKWILRKSMEERLPSELVWRTDKIGYEPPQKQWMEHPILIDYMHEAKRKLVQHDLLKPQVLLKKTDPKHAHERNNYEWRYLCTARLLG